MSQSISRFFLTSSLTSSWGPLALSFHPKRNVTQSHKRVVCQNSYLIFVHHTFDAIFLWRTESSSNLGGQYLCPFLWKSWFWQLQKGLHDLQVALSAVEGVFKLTLCRLLCTTSSKAPMLIGAFEHMHAAADWVLLQRCAPPCQPSWSWFWFLILDSDHSSLIMDSGPWPWFLVCWTYLIFVDNIFYSNSPLRKESSGRGGTHVF